MFQIKNLLVEDVISIQSLTVNAAVTSIEGQSGSGKSTFLRLLNNLDDPTSGDIYFKDEKLTNIEPMELRKRIVMVPQNPVVFDGTIKDNLNLGLELSGERAASDHELKDILQLFWIDKDLETDASDLSGGEKQRMALARVLLMKQAEVFLLDEPSSDLDDETTHHVMGEFLDKAAEQKQQVIMVTHNKQVTNQFANEKINMDDYSLSLRSGVKHDE